MSKKKKRKRKKAAPIIHITLPCEPVMFTRESVVALIVKLQEAIGDGANIRLSA